MGTQRSMLFTHKLLDEKYQQMLASINFLLLTRSTQNVFLTAGTSNSSPG